jgi:hypothetical protein
VRIRETYYFTSLPHYNILSGTIGSQFFEAFLNSIQDPNLKTFITNFLLDLEKKAKTVVHGLSSFNARHCSAVCSCIPMNTPM